MASCCNKCPNCGANVNLGNRNISFCEFCGTQITRKNEAKPHKENSELYNQVVFELKFEKYDKLKHTLFKALMEAPDNYDLLLIDAVLKSDASNIEQVEWSSVSDIVLSLCKREFLKIQFSFNYSLDLEAIKKYNLFNYNNIKLIKKDIKSDRDVKSYLSFAEVLLSKDDYHDKLLEVKKINDIEFADLVRKLERWKSVYRTRIIWCIIWFSLAIISVVFYVSASIFLLILFSSFGWFMFWARKKFIPK